MIKRLVSPELVQSGPYCHAVEMGDLVWTSGLGPHDPVTKAIPDGIEEQVEATLDNLERALALAGASLADVIKLTVYLQHLSEHKEALNRVCRRRLPEPHGVRTTVGANLLNILVEIDAVAVKQPS
jgi:enamine deaminase RidA (YjgF/YER057c/UK114 family)